MKILKKIKQGLLGIGIFFIILPTKAYARAEDFGLNMPVPLPKQTTSLFFEVWKRVGNVIFPIVSTIGIIVYLIIVYLKKSKSKTVRKIMTIATTVIIFYLAYMGLGFLIDNMI